MLLYKMSKHAFLRIQLIDMTTPEGLLVSFSIRAPKETPDTFPFSQQQPICDTIVPGNDYVFGISGMSVFTVASERGNDLACSYECVWTMAIDLKRDTFNGELLGNFT